MGSSIAGCTEGRIFLKKSDLTIRLVNPQNGARALKTTGVPRVSALSRMFACSLLKIMGWNIKGTSPDIPQYLCIAAPHTSNWDMFYFLLLASAMNVKLSFMAKRSLFKPPFGFLTRMLGGISIDRSKDSNVVDATIRVFREQERVVIALLPEATRTRTDHWKSGFYFIAQGANVPIVMFYMDFSRKEGGSSQPFYLTGDPDFDMDHIRAFYAGKQGHTPENASTIRLKDES